MHPPVGGLQLGRRSIHLGCWANREPALADLGCVRLRFLSEGAEAPRVPPGVEASALACRLTPRQESPQRVAKIGGGMSAMQSVSGAEVGFSIQAFRMFR